MNQHLSNEAFLRSARKMQDFYDLKPGAPIYEKEFGFYTKDKWIADGILEPDDGTFDYDVYLRRKFGFDEKVVHTLTGLGGCEAGMDPMFEVKILEDRGEYELVQDYAGRSVLYFKGRRDGFMPTYVDHPVKDMDSWERNIKWRMDPTSPGREKHAKWDIEQALQMRQNGGFVCQLVVGGYMYLRSLIGGEPLLYMFYDDPELIHECMRTWLDLADARMAYYQQFVEYDELLFDEDICYNMGPLISPDMIREFLFPYYQQLIENVKKRNRGHRIRIQLATDGRIQTVVDLYKSIGFDYFSPCEVASGVDVVELGKKYPDILISGGIDKRIIAQGGDAIKRHLEYIMPAMRARGGYIPTCDHGVPEEVSYENYLLFRKLLKEYCE